MTYEAHIFSEKVFNIGPIFEVWDDSGPARYGYRGYPGNGQNYVSYRPVLIKADSLEEALEKARSVEVRS